MAYMILQPCREYLEPNEIVDRLERVFAEVDIDIDTGNEFLADRIRALNKIRESLQDPPACLPKQIKRLEELQQRCLIATIKSQPEGAQIKVTLVPNEPALVAYDDETLQAGFWQCVDDFATAIDYEVEMPTEFEQSSTLVEQQRVAAFAPRWWRALALISQAAKHRWMAARACCVALVS